MATPLSPEGDFATLPAAGAKMFAAALSRPPHIGDDWLQPHQRQ